MCMIYLVEPDKDYCIVMTWNVNDEMNLFSLTGWLSYCQNGDQVSVDRSASKDWKSYSK